MKGRWEPVRLQKGEETMRRSATLILALTAALVLFGTGCSKAKTESDTLRGQLAEAQTQAKQAEERQKELLAQIDKSQLERAQEKVKADEAQRSLQLRLIHSPLEAFKVEPYASVENGWLVIDGERTYTLYGYPEAARVRFFWADANTGLKAQLLGEDSDGRNGWSWQGTLPFGIAKAFWAEIQYPTGVTAISPVLPVRNGGK